MNGNGRSAAARRRAFLGLALAGICSVVALAAPTAGAASWPWWWWPTTTKATTTTTTTTTTAAPTTTLPAGPCGPQIKKADGSYWACTFVEDFDGDTLDGTTWIAQQTAQSSFAPGGACYVDAPGNVSVSDGALHLTARQEAEPFVCPDPKGAFTTRYTAGSVSTFMRWSQAYGRFEVRAQFPGAKVQGLQSAIWLWPDKPTKYGPWPYSGEIDIAEAYSVHPDRVIPYIHYVPMAGDSKVTNNYCMIADVSDWNTYVVEWTTKTITIIYNGKVCTSTNWNPALPLLKPQPFDQPFMIALTQALGIGKNAFDPSLTPLPATTNVDYVRVWK
ncbi:MAG TPA: glycoside hydrolase family 16 protein [Acidimicrobiales bacterium]|nr:glycoside hydrolase family 16 protein [Acidimicrobiales bacterium]